MIIKKSKVHINLLRKLPDSLEAYAFYLILKSRFQNSVVYDYSPKTLSNLLSKQVSSYYCKKLPQQLISLGLAKIDASNHLVLQAYHSQGKQHIPIRIENQTIKQIKDELILLLSEFHINRVNYRQNLKRDYRNKSITKKSIKNKLRALAPGNEIFQGNSVISFKTLSKCVGIAKMTLYRAFKRLKKRGKVYFKTIERELMKGNHDIDFVNPGCHCYYSKKSDSIMMVLGTKFNLN